MDHHTARTACVCDDPDSFGYKLHHLGTQKQITKKSLMDLLQVSKATITRYESGQNYPAVEQVNAIAEYMGVAVDELYDDYIQFVMNFKDEVKMLREQLGLSHKQFAELVNIQAANTVYEWEIGRHLPNISIIRQLIKLETNINC